MKVRSKLKPGQRGTKRLLEQYGEKLFCVRYRYDEKSRKRYTTVELIVAEKPWQPPRFKPNELVKLQIDFCEVELRQKMKEVGGMWSHTTKLWKLPYKTVCKLKLENRIVVDEDELKNMERI